MKGLSSLIRLHRWQLQEKRLRLADLERLATELAERRERLEDELKQEQEVARGSGEARQAYAGYAVGVIERREKLAQSLAEVDQQIEALSREVTDAFREVKRYELAQRHRDRLARQKRARAERVMLDELGAELHRRREGT